MIIKRNLKSAMPTLKRCRISESGGDDDKSLGNRKKCKVNGYFPLHLLGEVAAGMIPFSGYGLNRILGSGGGDKVFGRVSAVASWCTEVSYCLNRVESKSKAKEEVVKESSDRVQKASRPPLVRTSRARVQVLPSRFNDSILDNWKKEKCNSTGKESILDPEFTPKIILKNPKFRGKRGSKKSGDVKISYQCRKRSPLSENETEELWKTSDMRKYSSMRSSLASLNGQLSSIHKSPNGEVDEAIDLEGIDDLSKEQSEQKSGIYGLEDFVSNDVVWAISGKQYPAWPAIVLDPLTQTSQQVLNYRVRGAVCVMFFGYSGNGTQRDYAWIKRGMIFPFLAYVDGFQGQTDFNDSNPGDLRSAIEEAFLAENGFNEMLMVEIHAAAGNFDYLDTLPRGILEATDSN